MQDVCGVGVLTAHAGAIILRIAMVKIIFIERVPCRFRFQSRDELVPWTVKGGNGAKDGEVLRRYCHLFEEGEIRRLCEGVHGIKVDSEYYDASNWCLVFTRC